MSRMMIIAVTLCWAAAAMASADLEWIVFTGGTKDKLGMDVRTLERIKQDGSGRMRIHTPADGKGSVKFPAISPRGKQLAAILGYNLWLMDWDGGNMINITPWAKEKYQPCWTPDGKRLFYCSDLNNDCEVFSINPDGSENRNLTWSQNSSDMAPSVSPDGKNITFISNRNGKFELFLMDVNGFGQRRLISLDGDIREPAWGANGPIAFALEKGGTSNLFTVSPDGKGLRQLTDGQSWDGQAAWSHDASKLAFASNRSGSPDIWILDMATGKTSNVTNTPDNDEFFPRWVPEQIATEPLSVTQANPDKLDLPRPRMLFRQEDIPSIKSRLEKEPYASG